MTQTGGGSVVVLVVDDVDAQRYAVRRALLAAGMDVIEAASGTEALQKAASNPDAIVLDVGLPDINGFEVCRRMKGDAHIDQIPVIFLSATFQGGASRDWALRAGAVAYLFQPVDPETLLTVIRAAIARRGVDSGR
jgi:CheY-like chemotaxis protein